MIDLNDTRTRRHAASDEITARIDKVISQEQRLEQIKWFVEQIAKTPPPQEERWGRSISASGVGDECARRVQLNAWPTFHPDQLPPKRAPLTDKDRAVFERGHLTEAQMGVWLKDAGFKLSVATEDGAQHGFTTAGGQIKGYADGVFQDAPHLWEHKTLGNTSWRKAWNHGVAKAHPKYDMQVHLLMPYMEADATLFTILNADTGALYAELAPCDPNKAQAASDRAVFLLQATRAGDLLPKAAASADAFPCQWCRFKAECWG